MFPLTDDSGRVICLSGRLWKMTEDGSHQAKYKNSRSTDYLIKAMNSIIWIKPRSAKSNMKCISWKALWMSLRLIELGLKMQSPLWGQP